MRRLIKWAIICFCVFIAIFVIAASVLPGMYEEKIRVDLEKEFDQRLNADVTFSRVDIKLFRHFPNMTCSVKDLLVVGIDEFKSDTLASIKETQLEVNIWSILFKREVEIKSIHLFNPRISVYVLKDGHANYDIAKPTVDSTATTQKKSNVNIAIDNVSIHQGRMTYEDWQRNIFVTAEEVEHTGSGDFLQDVFDYKTETIVQHLSLNYDNVQYLLKKTVGLDLILEMNLPESKYTFKENKIQINHFIFSIEGFFQQVVNEYAMKLKFQAEETTFKNILSLVPGLYLKNFDYMETRGDLGFNGSLEGVYSDSTNEMPAFHFDMKVKDAMVKIDSLPEAFNNIQFELVIDNRERILDSTIIDLRNFQLELGKHPVHGRIKVQGLHKPKIDADIFADAELASLERLFPVNKLTLKGKVNFELKASGVYDAKSNTVPAFNLNLQLADGYIRYDSLPRPVNNIHFHLNAESKDGKLENAMFDFRKIHAELDDNILHGFLKLKGYPDTEVDCDLDANLDLEDIEKIYPVDGYTLKGKLNLDLLAKGLYSKAKKKFPFVDSKMNLTDGFIQYKGYPHPISNIHFFSEVTSKTGTLDDAKLEISKLTYTLEEEPFEISGSVTDLNNYSYNFKMDGKADLSKLSQVYPIEGVQLTGLVDAHIGTSGLVSDLEKGNYTKVASRGKIKFSNINVTGDKIPNPIKIDSAVFKFTPGKIILAKLEGKLGSANMKVKGDIVNYMAFVTNSKEMIKGDLDFECDTLNINEWMPPAQTASGKPITAADTAHSKLTVIEIPRNIEFVFDSHIKGLRYDDLKLTDMEGEIVIRDGVLSLHETGFNSLNARFNLSGDYNTRDMAHPVFAMDLDVKDLDINKAYRSVKLMRQLAPSAANVYGKFSVTYKLKGELAKDMEPKLETLTGGGVMRIAEAKINGMKLFEEISKGAKKDEIKDPHLKDFMMETEIRDSKIIVKPFSIVVSGFDTDIEGVNTMSGMINYLVKIELIPFPKIKIPFHVTGRYDNPKVALGKGHTLPY